MDNLYYLTAYFLIYGFLGWVLEVVFHAVCVGKVINRGFLNGPICPIYGVGMLGILTLLSPLEDHPLLLYAGGILFATLVELVGGFVLYRLFHLRWWDYSDEPFNLGGYICLKFSIAWGICIIFVLKLIHPVIRLNVHILDNLLGHVVIALLYVLFTADLIITVLSIMNLNRDLKKLNALAEDIRHTSDTLTDRIASKAIETEVKVQEGRVQAALARAEFRDKLEDLRDRTDQLTDGVRDKAGDLTEDLRDRIEDLTEEIQDRAEDLTDEFLEKAEDFREKVDELHEKAEQFGERLLQHPRSLRTFNYQRLRRAYPRLHHAEYDRELKSVMEVLRDRKSLLRKDKKQNENMQTENSCCESNGKREEKY
ncbi:MAG: hypothetical protein Q4B85_06980 [Lachnospiraceae bacterium]|nr:hypothetical protein [Lachnospiraceae bacterium]